MIYGYIRRKVNEYGLREMKEISIAASPEELRELAKFLVATASQMDQPVHANWHRHVPGTLSEKLACDVVVAPPRRDSAL